MQNKKDFNKVIVIGMSVVSLILIGFPIIAYFAYQNETGEVENYIKLDNIKEPTNRKSIYSNCFTPINF